MDVHLLGVSKSYGDVAALHPIDVSLADGRFVSVLGPSGCGKSTLLRCLAGLELPQRGRISFGERAVFDAEKRVNVPARRRRLGMVFQDLALWPHLTVFENVAFPLRSRGERADLASRVEAALDCVRLATLRRRFPHELSGGQQQRVAFARAVVAEPDLLLMDEPLSALDAGLRAELRAELGRLTRDLGLTTLYVTHDQEEAMAMSDRILVMHEGRLLQDSPPEELYRSPADSRIAELVGRFNRLPAQTAPRSVAGVRPERVGIGAESTGDIRLNGRIAACSYVGGRYELRCRVEGSDGEWTVYTAAPPPLGAEVDLRVASTDLISLDA